MIKKSLGVFLLIVGILAVAAVATFGMSQEPLYSSSVPGHVFDIIEASDPSAFSCLEYVGRDERELWDERVDGQPSVNVFLFRARYQDGTDIEIAINPEFGSIEAAQKEAEIYTRPLGQLPSVLREGIEIFTVHKGDEAFHAGTGSITMYADRVRQRLSEKHLEESVFHESVHTSWDAKYEESPRWLNAQQEDGRFVTQYGFDKEPSRGEEGEDLAETALFAYGVSHFPGRIPPADTEDIMAAVPNRIKFIETLLPPGEPIFFDTVEVTCE